MCNYFVNSNSIFTFMTNTRSLYFKIYYNMMRNIFWFMFVSLFCCTGLICNGQQITQQTTVTVLNENGSPAVNAIAFRLSKNDLAIRQTVMADSAGRIVFPGNVDFGKEFCQNHRIRI